MSDLINYLLNVNWTTFVLLICIGLFNAISELSNHGKLDHWWYWFSQAAWQNKNTWKPYPLWRRWPFIIFTDAFHAFKFLWVIALSCAVWLGGIDPFFSFAIYSTSFTIFYVIVPFIKVK